MRSSSVGEANTVQNPMSFDQTQWPPLASQITVRSSALASPYGSSISRLRPSSGVALVVRAKARVCSADEVVEVDLGGHGAAG